MVMHQPWWYKEFDQSPRRPGLVVVGSPIAIHLLHLLAEVDTAHRTIAHKQYIAAHGDKSYGYIDHLHKDNALQLGSWIHIEDTRIGEATVD